MQDDLTWGIDLSGSPWRCATLLSGLGGTSHQGEAREVDGPDLLREAGPLLIPRSSGDPSPPEGDDRDDLRESLRLAREPIRALLPDHPLIGVAYPRSMPPILRQYLPIVLGCAPATSRGGLPFDSPLIGLDAPVALVLEAIASGAIPVSGLYAVATGGDPGPEWTAVEIEKGPASNPSILRIRMGPTGPSPGSLGLGDGATRLVADDGPDAALDPAGPLVRMGPSATALGAARFARWHSLEFSKRPSAIDRRLQAALLPGTPVFAHEVPFPIGLIGDNGEGAWFWRRLWEPGTSIPTPRASLRSSTLSDCRFAFAEVLNLAYRRHLWLTQDEWRLAGLRWHSAHTPTNLGSPQPPIRWSIQLRDFNDTRRDISTPREEVPPRWGLPTWTARIEAANGE